MDTFYIVKDRVAAELLIEAEAWEGVRRVGGTMGGDIETVSGCAPVRREALEQCAAERVVLAATAGRSPLLARLEREGRLSLAAVTGKREVFLMQILEDPFPEAPQVKQLLLIAGSDKRGTIYGMFRLSELCGVSPLVFWGDAAPEKDPEPAVFLAEPFVSKEPSVRYRGFFINDEWPAFGSWCTERFGGVNAKAYQMIFELLLRLKGNYLWPAMWRSSFSEDGPGLDSAELADCYGVIMGASHHEPMCRAGVEWQNQYAHYGTDPAWSFITNREAITKFWADGVRRNRPFENVITIGMRGENDSKLLPQDATLADNIAVLQDAIRTQHGLLRELVDPDLKKVPRMLAIYKEVEDYYFGDADTPGLADWEELSDVIFLLSDDNWGNLRSLPCGKDHPGGYGMYYHFDYHGGPISYEWVNCSRLTKTWEQLTLAYESGVREMWIVNVGDLKNMEYPLSYFMELAYDCEGNAAPNQTEAFLRRWIVRQFGGRLTEEQSRLMAEVMEGYTKWNALRTPESMAVGVYHPVHFRESERVWEQVHGVMEKAERLNRELSGEALAAYQSMIYFQAMASMNLILMYLEAGINRELAERGCVRANLYAERAQRRIAEDARYVEAFHRANGGKWNHCMSSAHTGFRVWDDHDWTYPAVMRVSPIPGAKAVVSFRGSGAYHLGAHWQDREPLVSDGFTRPDTAEVLLDVDSRGDVLFTCAAEFDAPWLRCAAAEGECPGHAVLRFTADRSLLRGREAASVTVRISFANGQTTTSALRIEAEPAPELEPGVFLERQGYCAIRAEHFCGRRDADGGGFRTVDFLGREGAAVKAFPPERFWEDPERAPRLQYALLAERAGRYQLELFLLARNPANRGGRMRFAVSVNGEAPRQVWAVSEDYRVGQDDGEWARGVLSRGRRSSMEVLLKKGRNDIYFYAGDPGVVLEKLVLHALPLPESYLGPEESFCAAPPVC